MERTAENQKRIYDRRYTSPDLIRINGLSEKKCHKFTKFYRRYSSHDKYYIQKINELSNELKRPVDLLEIGCGSGVFAQQLFDSGSNITYLGIDISKTGIEKAKERNLDNFEFVEGDFFNYDFHGQNYDLVISSAVAEHVPDPEKLLDLQISLARSNGCVIFAYPSFEYWRFWNLPLYIILKLLGKEFEYHGIPGRKIFDKIKRTNTAKLFSKTFIPPRSYFKIIPCFLFTTAGVYWKFLDNIARIGGLGHLGYFQIIELINTGSGKKVKDRFSLVSLVMQVIFYGLSLPVILPLWIYLISSVSVKKLSRFRA